jgi:hypothetical protein
MARRRAALSHRAAWSPARKSAAPFAPLPPSFRGVGTASAAATRGAPARLPRRALRRVGRRTVHSGPRWRDVEQPSRVAHRTCPAAERHRQRPTRVGRRNCALRFVRFAVAAHALGAAAIIGWFGPGSFAACTDMGHSVGTDHGKQDRRDENLRAQLAHLDRPPSHGWPHPMPSARWSAPRSHRARMALSIGTTSEPRDQRQHHNAPGGGADGVGEEYGISAAGNPGADQPAIG